MCYVVFMQQAHNSDWVPFFKQKFEDAQELADKLMKKEEYSEYYVAKVLTYSHDFHSKELGLT